MVSMGSVGKFEAPGDDGEGRDDWGAFPGPPGTGITGCSLLKQCSLGRSGIVW